MPLLPAIFETKLLKEYFSKDPRYEFKGLISQGHHAHTYRARCVDPEASGEIDLVVKKAINTQFSKEALRKERDYLKSFLGGAHIVKILNIEDNPLEKEGFPGEWIILEWLPHGTIIDFVNYMRRHNIPRLPNRVLWRFFLCLIRACCSMAWPRNFTDGQEQLEFPIEGRELSGLAHNDLHGGNVLIGEFGSDIEHSITPILKFIDFGSTGPPAGAGMGTGEQQNIFDIGALMMILIAVDPTINPRNHDTVDIRAVGRNMTSRASWIFRPNDERPEGLDEWLGDLVGACLAVDPLRRPSLQDLSDHVTYAVYHRDAKYYNNEYFESNIAIRTLCQLIISGINT
ncbi:kinase-like protein [Hypoxylon sp. NC0597]|nr:kinase-like protein [Hypoxylon sp. NC0597]